MKKHILRLLLALLCMPFFYCLNILHNELVISTLFTVASIFVSIGLSLIISFDITSVGNDAFFEKISKNLMEIQHCFLFYYFCIVLAYLAGMSFLRGGDTAWTFWPHLHCQRLAVSLCFSLLTLGIAYFIANFCELQKLKNDISSRLRKDGP